MSWFWWPPLPFALATLSLLLLELAQHTAASGPLHWLFPLPELFCCPLQGFTFWLLIAQLPMGLPDQLSLSVVPPVYVHQHPFLPLKLSCFGVHFLVQHGTLCKKPSPESRGGVCLVRGSLCERGVSECL